MIENRIFLAALAVDCANTAWGASFGRCGRCFPCNLALLAVWHLARSVRDAAARSAAILATYWSHLHSSGTEWLRPTELDIIFALASQFTNQITNAPPKMLINGGQRLRRGSVKMQLQLHIKIHIHSRFHTHLHLGPIPIPLSAPTAYNFHELSIVDNN